MSRAGDELQHDKYHRFGVFAMAVNAAAAYGMYSEDVSLPDIVRDLNRAGFQNEDICMMLSPAHPIASIVRDARLFNSERETSARSAGLIGWLSEFGAVLIPTVGFFIRSQAFFHALLVAREAPALCGNARTLVGLGFSEEDAERFEHRLADHSVLVYISCAEGAKTMWARDVLRHSGAHEAATLEARLEERMSVAVTA
jgi:hypothetical protein